MKLSETKVFHFHGLQGWGSSEPPEPPLDPPLVGGLASDSLIGIATIMQLRMCALKIVHIQVKSANVKVRSSKHTRSLTGVTALWSLSKTHLS